jgi:solute carrier family 25 phosphate transporter 23/24/25/41
MTYESVRMYLTPEGDKNPSSARKLLAGAISGAVAQTCTYPLSVVSPLSLSVYKYESSQN